MHQDRKRAEGRIHGRGNRTMLGRLYGHRYAVVAGTVLVIFGLIVGGYLGRINAIDFGIGSVSDWPNYGRDESGTRYAPTNQINRNNVAYLEQAWEYHTGDFSDGSDGRPETTFQATPIVVDGILYLATVYGRVIALNPDTGTEIWTYDPGVDATVERGEFANRGVSYWRAADAVQGRACERRILVATVGARLIALDAARGT